MDFVFGFQTLWLQDFSIIYQLKGLKPKTKGHMNFYECCDLTEKVYLPLHTTVCTTEQIVSSSDSCDWRGEQQAWEEDWKMILSFFKWPPKRFADNPTTLG